MSRQLSDMHARGLAPQDSFTQAQPGHSRQASFSRQESLDTYPSMSQPGRVAYGEDLAFNAS